MVYKKDIIKALILVGGVGTRLKPLTSKLPKPLVPFINKPILRHQIEALVGVGIKEIVLALNYYSELIINEVKSYSDEFNISIVYSKENDPLGTAGPIAFAKRHLKDSKFFVLNSDIICKFPFKEMLEYHNLHNLEGTILATMVDDARRYGVIKLHKGTSLISCFHEKPSEAFECRINAGIYVFNSSILDRIEIKECSLEREIFPYMAIEGQLSVYDLEGFWMDIGQPKDYIIGQRLYLENFTVKSKNVGVSQNVVVGENVKICKGAVLKNCTIFDNVTIGDKAIITNSIIGWNCVIGDNAQIIDSVLGFGVEIKPNSKVEEELIESANKKHE